MANSKKSGQQEPAGDTGTKTGIRNRFRVLQRHLTLADYIFGPIPAVLLAAATVLADFRYWASVALILGSALLVFFILAHLHYRHGFKKQQKISLLDGIGSFLAVALVIAALVVFDNRYYRQTALVEENEATQAASPESTSTPSPYRLVIKYIRTDWGHQYNPRTLIMAYYLVNNQPTLSPIDLWLDLRVLNLQPHPVTIEAWSVETGPTPNGLWLRLLHIPASPHLTFYIVGSLRNVLSGALKFQDLGDALLNPIQPRAEAQGWVLCECPYKPPCLAWFERIRLRDTEGHNFSEVLDLSTYNESLKLDPTEDSGIPVSKAPRRDLTNVPVLRPFPTDAYRVEPKDEKDVARLYRGAPGPSRTPTPSRSNQGEV